MGNQTTVIIRNDAIDQIRKHPEEFVSNLLDAIDRIGWHDNGLDFPTGHHANVGRVVETHHADSTTIVACGGQTATVLATLYNAWRWPSLEAELLAAIVGLQVAKADAQREGK